MTKIMKAGQEITSKSVNANIILNEQTRQANELLRQQRIAKVEEDLELGIGAFTTDTEIILARQGKSTLLQNLISKDKQLEQTNAEFQQVIANVTIDSEVINARGGKTTLKERLDDEWDNVNAQLEDKVQNFKIKNEVVNGDFNNGIDNIIGLYSGVSKSLVDGRLKIDIANEISGYATLFSIAEVGNPTTNKLYISFDSESSFTSRFYGFSGGPITVPVGKSKISAVSVGTTYTMQHREFRKHTLGQDIPSGAWIFLDNFLRIDLTKVFGAGNEPTKLEMDELMKVIPNGWWDGELSLTQKQFITWQLNLIRKNTNAIIALGGTII